mgnify:CR=1 FL=1
MCEDGRIAHQREHQSIDRAPEVGGMADVVHVALGRPPAIQQVQRCKDVSGYRDGYQVDVDSHLRLEQDAGKKNGRHSAGSSHCVVIPVVLELDKVPD